MSRRCESICPRREPHLVLVKAGPQCRDVARIERTVTDQFIGQLGSDRLAAEIELPQSLLLNPQADVEIRAGDRVVGVGNRNAGNRLAELASNRARTGSTESLLSSAAAAGTATPRDDRRCGEALLRFGRRRTGRSSSGPVPL